MVGYLLCAVVNFNDFQSLRQSANAEQNKSNGF